MTSKQTEKRAQLAERANIRKKPISFFDAQKQEASSTQGSYPQSSNKSP